MAELSRADSSRGVARSGESAAGPGRACARRAGSHVAGLGHDKSSISIRSVVSGRGGAVFVPPIPPIQPIPPLSLRMLLMVMEDVGDAPAAGHEGERDEVRR